MSADNPLDKLKSQARIARESGGMVVLTPDEAERILLFITGATSVNLNLTAEQVAELMKDGPGGAVSVVPSSFAGSFAQVSQAMQKLVDDEDLRTQLFGPAPPEKPADER